MISVVVPCYNSARYLRACVESILDQRTELEILLVDDGSKDETPEVIERLKADPRVRAYALAQNGGVSRARNFALDRARGEWVAFVDADDLLPEGAFETLLAAASPDVEVIVGSHEEFDENGARTRFRPEAYIRGRDTCRDRETVTRRLIEGDSVYNIMCNKLHRTEMLRRANIRLSEDVRIGEDALFNLQAFAAAKKFVYVDEVTYLYRVHGGSAMRSVGLGEFERQKPFFEALQRLLEAHGRLEKYFVPVVNSMVLRLYKESGFSGVLRRFNRDLRPLLHMDAMKIGDRAGTECVYTLVRTGAYPAAYVLIFPCQVLRRKSLAMWRWLHGR